MIQMNLLIKQKETHRLQEQTYGYQGWRMEEGIVGEFRMDMYTLLYLIFLLICVFYWSIVDFQAHSRWFRYTYTHIVSQITLPDKLIQNIDYSSLCYTVNLCCLLHIYFFLIRNLA